MSELYESRCPACGIHYGMDKFLEGERRSDGNTFWCPNGHQLGFPKSAPEVETLRAKVRDLEAKLEKANAEVDRLRVELEVWAPRKDGENATT